MFGKEKKEKNPCFLVALFIIFLSCFVVEVHGKKQTQVLGHLYREKRKGSNSSVDSGVFRGTHNVNATRIHSQKGLKEKDRIVKLPGQPEVEFSQYGGYVTVDKFAERAMFYYFVEAQHSKDSLPLLLWLNGGPECSSLGFGAMEELGPFHVNSDGKTLYRNRFSWNKAANVLFLESSAGVGFSYWNRTSDYQNTGYKQTVKDNYVFLINWLETFPEYKDREFYISGESYAGHYVPQLAHAILNHNKKANKTIINLKGIIIGNAVINDQTDIEGIFCYAAVNEAEETFQDLDIYNIYAPLCTQGNLTNRPRKSLGIFDPCSDNYVSAYLNRPNVQEALHANVTGLKIDWQPCSEVLGNWQDSPSTVIPLLKELMAAGLRVWVYSGDLDGRVPVTSTRSSLNVMKLPVKTAWHPWFLKGEVGGYTQVYSGDLTLVTVRGAGHEVPSYQPRRALSVIKHFLPSTPLPDASQNT